MGVIFGTVIVIKHILENVKNTGKIMDYHKIYNQLIERSKNRSLDGYKEIHHILPKCCGGIDIQTNLVELTAREHFIAHLLLCKIHPDHKGLRLALWMMSNVKDQKQKRYFPNSRLYEMIRLEYLESISGENNPNFGKTHSRETRQKMSEMAKERIGEKNNFYGKSHSDETKEKMKESLVGSEHSEETKKKMSNTKKGKPSGRKGKVNSPEHNKKTSEALKKSWELRKLKNK
jgi:hypothetical protein